MARAEKTKVDWQFKNLDTGEILNPPYPVDENGIKISVGGNYAEQSRFGFQDPIIQWTSGKARTIDFSTVLFAANVNETIVNEFSKFEKLALFDEKYGRPP